MSSQFSTTAAQARLDPGNALGGHSRQKPLEADASVQLQAVVPSEIIEMLQTSAAEAGSGLVLMNMSLQPIGADRGAIDILRSCSRSPTNSDQKIVQIPDEILAGIMNARHSGESLSGMSLTFGGGRYRCRLYAIQTTQPNLKGGLIALHLDKAAETCDPLSSVMATYHLTEREGEALRGIALGLSTKEMADRMGISPNTVKSFVRLIMIKLNVTSRAAIMVKLLEKNGR